MRKVVLPIIMAASLLMGCGSTVSLDDMVDIAEQEVERAPNNIKVFGIEFWDAGQSEVKDELAEGTAEGEGITPVVGNPINTDKRIACWGDSLTEGTGGDGVTFPDVLATLSGATVFNYGVYNDTSSIIAARQGGKLSHVEDISEIPADTVPVKVNIVEDDGTWDPWCNFGDAGVNPCIISGVEGTLSIDYSDGSRYFTRSAAGQAVSVSDTRFTTHAMLDKKEGDILVIWSGSSDGLMDGGNIDEVIRNQRAMLAYANCDQYVIINFTADVSIGAERMPEWNARLEQEYGEHYLDIDSYLVNYGLADAGITPTDDDLSRIEAGLVPTSLLADEVHGTSEFYRIIGERVYLKLLELGYIQ